MTRRAILVTNRAATSDPSLSVTSSEVTKNTSRFKQRLRQLGQHSFKVPDEAVVVDEERDAAYTKIKGAIREASKALGDDGDCLLFYYFGHGVERSNTLYFVFKDSDPGSLPSLLSFEEIVELITGFGVQKVIFVLDCCFAGASAHRIHAQMGAGTRFSIVASVASIQRAYVATGPSPFGAFSLCFFDGLRDSDAASLPGKEITVASLFDYCAARLGSQGQAPQIIDGGLNNFVLATVEPERRIPDELDLTAPRKSFYRKVWWIVSTIHDRPNVGPAALYRIVERERPVEMLTPVKHGASIKHEPVSFGTFESYLYRISALGMLREGSPLALTPVGSSMVAANGRKFNSTMLKLVESQFQAARSSLEAIDLLVRLKLKIRGIPTAMEIFLDARRSPGISLQPEWFAILLGLAGNCGYFRTSSRKTFFPY
jgi:hypothetical protein